jgi:N-acetylglucosaminyldiphosphoundecaprenol N-acetyl-beta-D-mannosaminyltransferase
VFFTNVHSIHLARRDQDFMRLINSADLALPDGAGLKIAGRLFGTPVVENLNGTDLTPRFLKVAESERLTVYLLGGLPEVVEGCYRWLSKEYPQLRIVGFRHGHFLPEEENAIIEEINAAQPHILLVALGSPRQERWIARNSQYLKAGVCVGVGGLFDFLSGSKSRAPQWMRRLGIEWVYRFIQDPKTKWDRVFIEIPTFLALIAAKQLMSGRLRTLLIRKNDAP